jgi:CHAD domain-containing protein
LNAWAAGLIDKRIATFEARARRAHKRGLDGERLHDLRTAARRLRSALEDIGTLVPYSRRNLRLVKRVGDATGDARDLAVLVGRLQTYRALAGKRERAEIDGLIVTLERRERRALKHAKLAMSERPKPKRPPGNSATKEVTP